MATVLAVFEKWKQFLGERVDQAQRTGMSDEVISKLAFNIGEFLTNQIDPKNTEERLLKELWDAGDEQDKKALARMMIKLVDKE
jgi:hypothetical protein